MAANLRWLGYTKMDPTAVKAARRIRWADRLWVWMRDDGMCRYCGQDAYHCSFRWIGGKMSRGPHLGHVVPVHQGGLGTIDNLVLSCHTCNETKGPRTPQQAGMRLLPVCEAT